MGTTCEMPGTASRLRRTTVSASRRSSMASSTFSEVRAMKVMLLEAAMAESLAARWRAATRSGHSALSRARRASANSWW